MDLVDGDDSGEEEVSDDYSADESDEADMAPAPLRPMSESNANDRIFSNTDGFDAARAHAVSRAALIDAADDESFVPTREQIMTLTLQYRSEYAEARKNRQKLVDEANINRNAQQAVRPEGAKGQAQKLVSNAKSSMAISVGVPAENGMGKISPIVIAWNERDPKRRQQVFTQRFNEIVETTVFARTQRSEEHSVHLHNHNTLQILKEYGITIMEIAKKTTRALEDDLKWMKKAAVWTNRFTAQILSIKHASPSATALKVVDYVSFRNDAKFDGDDPADVIAAIEKRVTDIFAVSSASYSTYAVAVNKEGLAKDRLRSGNSKKTTQRNKEDSKDAKRTTARKTYSGRQKNWSNRDQDSDD